MRRNLILTIMFLVCLGAGLSAPGQEVLSPLEREVVQKDEINKPLQHQSRTGTFIWLLVPLGLAAFLRTSFEKDLAERWTALLNRNLAQQVYRDREFALHPRSLMLQLLFMLSMGTWLAASAILLDIEVPGWVGWRIFLLGVLAVGFFGTLRDALRRAVGALWRLDEEVGFFNFHVMLLNGLGGLLLIPFLFVMLLGGAELARLAMVISLIMLGILFLIRGFIGFQLGSGFLTQNPIHFILYICTLEIVPVLLLYKGLMGWFIAG